MKSKIVKIDENVQVETITLRRGDIIKVIESSISVEGDFVENYNKCNDAVIGMDFATDDNTLRRYLSDIDKALLGIEKYLDKNNLWGI